MPNPTSIPLSIGGGQWSSGDAMTMPDGSLRELTNYLARPGRYPSVPPLVSDARPTLIGMGTWDDTANKAERLVGIDSSRAVFVKSATRNTETWGSTVGTIGSGARLTAVVNYRGTLYGLLDDGTGLPLSAFSYDGTTLSSAPFNSTIAAKAAVVYKERMYLLYPRVIVSPLTTTGGVSVAQYGYDWAFATAGFQFWRAANVSVSNIVSGGKTTCRLFPTSTADRACSMHYTSNRFGAGGFWMFTVPVSTTPTLITWLFGVRPVDPANRVPLTLSMSAGTIGGFVAVPGAVVNQGEVWLANGYMYRVITTGTIDTFVTGGWPVTVGTTFSDAAGTAVILVEQLATFGTLDNVFVPNATEQQGVVWYTLTATIPVGYGSGMFGQFCGVYPTLTFGNTSQPALTTLSPIDVSFKDGLADGTVGKSNFGTQFTYGDYLYPFHNREDGAAATIDLDELIYSEVGLPKSFAPSSTFKLREAVGYGTAITAVENRLLAFKRSAMWQYTVTADPDVPLVLENFVPHVGCVGSRAIDTYGRTAFWIGESDIYAYSPGAQEPTPICGNGMREEIMDKGAGWVETYAGEANLQPLLAIDQTQRILWAYTQAGKLYAYDLATSKWSTRTLPASQQLHSLKWNRNTGNLYLGLTAGVRMSYTSTGALDDIGNGNGAFYSVDKTLTFRPLEFDPDQIVATVTRFLLDISTSTTPTPQSLTLSVSFDQGTTWPHSVTATASTLTSALGKFQRLILPVQRTGSSITLRLVASGPTGEATWSVSPRAAVQILPRRGEYGKVKPTAGVAT